MSAVAPFLIGIPLAAGFLTLVLNGPFQDSPLQRYLHHPVEMVEVVMFSCACTALVLKLLGGSRERAALKIEMLPPWDGQPIPVSAAPGLRAALHDRAGKWLGSIVVRRVDAVLDFVGCRGSADGLDDQLRALADTDAVAQENSFALIRFITWAIPILGFLGTVLGITTAIAGVTPEALEHSISSVTDGLAVAFDATAVALSLTMVTMFLSLIAERVEQGVLEGVDRFAEVQLAHRFERGGTDQSETTVALRRNTEVILQTTEKLVRQQAAVWANALGAAQQQWADAAGKQERLLAQTLEKALEKTLTTHQARLATVERQVEEKSSTLVGHMTALAKVLQDMARDHQTGMTKTTEALAAQTTALAKLQDDGKQLVRLQDGLHQNLAALQGAGAFEEAVQSLTAAIHLLTAKSGVGAAGQPNSRLGGRTGNAA
jgi:hypothetical protein